MKPSYIKCLTLHFFYPLYSLTSSSAVEILTKALHKYVYVQKKQTPLTGALAQVMVNQTSCMGNTKRVILNLLYVLTK